MAEKENPTYLSGVANDGTVIMTFADEVAAQKYRNAVATYDPENKLYSAYLNETGSS